MLNGVTSSREHALYDQPIAKEKNMSILWIILIVVLVLALLGFFGRGRF
jgi:flagellar basal body-associated protein FliL